MKYTLVIGGTKGIGAVIADRFDEEPGQVAVRWGRAHGDLPGGANITNLILCQRYRGDGDPWQGEIDTSLSLTKRAIETLPLSDGASVVIISSVISQTVADEQPVSYHMAKSALEGMARYYAVKMGPRGIRVNCVAPSVTLKPENLKYYTEERPDKMKLFSELNPIGRMVTATDVAETVYAVCYHMPATTGEVIRCDGGVHCLNVESVARRFLPKG